MLRLLGMLICVLVVGNKGQKMLGAGKWTVQNVQRCDNDDDMSWKLDVKRHRFNRTHDAFDVDMELLDLLDDSYAIRIDVCKVVDGGCKPYMTLKDDCLPEFVNKYAQGNVELALAAGGIDPPQFPINKGEYHIKNFMLNNDDLPKDGVYGEYEVNAFIVKEVDIACCKGFLRYTPEDDDEQNPTPFG